jgi:hypothetical protein
MHIGGPLPPVPALALPPLDVPPLPAIAVEPPLAFVPALLPPALVPALLVELPPFGAPVTGTTPPFAPLSLLHPETTQASVTATDSA